VKTGLKEIQSRLEEGTVLLEYWAGQSGSAVLFATRSEAGIRTRSAVDGNAIRQAAAGQAATEWRDLSARFGAALLRDVPPLRAAALRNIIIVPDGGLSLIPFELLADPEAGDRQPKLLVGKTGWLDAAVEPPDACLCRPCRAILGGRVVRFGHG
jgi:hypothetical protein